MVDVEEDDAVVGDLVTEVALFGQFPPFLPALFAPVVDEAVVAPADILLEPAMVRAVHPAVGIAGLWRSRSITLRMRLCPGGSCLSILSSLVVKAGVG